MKNPINEEMVMIKWADSAASCLNWHWESEWTTDVVTIISIGFLIRETNDTITIIPNISLPKDGEERQGRGELTVPRQTIISMERIKLASCSKTK